MGNVPGQLGTFSEDLRAGAQRAACLVRDALAVPKSRRLSCCFPGVGDQAREADGEIWPAPPPLVSISRDPCF